MGILAFIGIIIFTGINWSVYHKMFRVTYFGGAGSAILRELLICCFIAYIEVGLIVKFLGSALKIIFYIAMIVVAICIIGFIVKLINDKKEGTKK